LLTKLARWPLSSLVGSTLHTSQKRVPHLTRISTRPPASTVCYAWHPACSLGWHLSSSRNLREEAHLP
jgi:hypothetical protein